MRISVRLLLPLAAAALLTSAHYKVQSSIVMSETAKAFLASLNADQVTKAKMPMSAKSFYEFHFVPDNNYEQFYKTNRKGLTIREMTPSQRHLAQSLLASCLSQRGFIKATSIMSLEEILKVMENDSGERRNPEKYYFSIYGDPSESGKWALRVEGHHLSLNFFLAGGKVVGAPMFFGTNPAEVRQGPRKGMRVLAKEDDLGRDLLKSLTADQKKTAIVNSEAYPDILTAVQRKAALAGQPSGLAVTKMNAKQKELLNVLLHEYANNVPEDMAAVRHELIKKAGNSLHFAWAGVEEKGGPHYYRIQGSTFLIEYDNTQNEANHVHAMWRDLNGDFGEDVLKAHYEESHQSVKAE